MATGESNTYNIPYPVGTDGVNVHGDIKSLVDRLEIILPPLGVGYFQVQVLNNSGETLPAGFPVYASGYDAVSGKTTIAKALPDTTNPILGLVKTELTDSEQGIVVVAGVMEDINTSGFNDGAVLYVDTNGGLTATRPSNGSGAVGIVAASAASGVIIVEAKGNGTWGALRDGLA